MVSDITVGMKLAEDIRNPFGNVLATAGTVIDNKILSVMKMSRIHRARVENSEAEVREYLDRRGSLRGDMIGCRNKTVFSSEQAVESIVDNMMEFIISSGNEVEYVDLLSRMKQHSETVFAHSVNVAMICHQYALWNNLPPQKNRELVLAGLIHDVGKMEVPVSILDSVKPLTEAEFVKVRKHAIDGYVLLKNSKIPEIIKRPVIDHHERCDGSGYPMGYSFVQISEYGRIIGVIDSYEAMTARRAYRNSLCPFEIINIMTKDSDGKYDGSVMDNLFFNVLGTYVGGKVLLSNGYTVRLKALNKHALTTPVVEINGQSIDLSIEQARRKDIRVVKVVTEE
jgi:putative nucleotidyltransferase with HDIG domain